MTSEALVIALAAPAPLPAAGEVTVVEPGVPTVDGLPADAGALSADLEVGAVDEGGHFPPFEGEWFASQLLWLAILFGGFYWLMAKVALPRVASILEVRRDRIAADLAEAERSKGETDAAIAAYEQALAEARKNANAIASANREAVNADLEQKRRAADAELAAKLADAEARIAGIKAQAMRDVGAIATETTEAIVATLVGNASREEAAAAVAAATRS